MKKPNQFSLLDNLRYFVEIEYDTDRSNCNCEGMCRCSRIVNAKITSVSLDSIFKQLSEGKNKIDQYVIDRAIRIHKLYDTSLYSISIKDSYYGQEIGSVDLSMTTASKCEKDIKRITNLKNITEKVKAILTLEYGYLLDSLKHKTFNFITIEKDQLLFGQRDHYIRLEKDIVDQYKNHTLPCGVIIKDCETQDRYRLIDGYHRCAAASDKFEVIYGG